MRHARAVPGPWVRGPRAPHHADDGPTGAASPAGPEPATPEAVASVSDTTSIGVEAHWTAVEHRADYERLLMLLFQPKRRTQAKGGGDVRGREKTEVA